MPTTGLSPPCGFHAGRDDRQEDEAHGEERRVDRELPRGRTRVSACA
jgi:hypothetical protein